VAAGTMRGELPEAVQAALECVVQRQKNSPTTPLSCSTRGPDVQAFCMLVVECHKASRADEDWCFEGEMLAKRCEIEGVDQALREALASDFDVGINVLGAEKSGSLSLGPMYWRPPWTAEP
jgi:hypothetical protein